MRQQDAGLFIERLPGMSSWWDVTAGVSRGRSLVTATTALRKSGRRNTILADGAGRAAVLSVKNINQHHL